MDLELALSSTQPTRARTLGRGGGWPLALLTRVVAILLLTAAVAATPALAQQDGGEAPEVKLGPSGLPLPRFVSLKSGRVNMRVGPGVQYAVSWLYLKAGLPMEVIQEYDNWRRVRDADGADGWINQALLSGERTGIIAPWFKGKRASVPLLADAQEGSRQVAGVEPGAIGKVETCDGEWCRMSFGSHRGWIAQSSVWGVYPGETVQE